MARESFEDLEIADILNKYYVSVKVDKEERPDIDSIYMAVCQAFTGRGGWPVSIFMTAEQKPFFAGTYFPKTARYGAVGLKELLLIIQQKWKNERDALLRSANKITEALHQHRTPASQADKTLPDTALQWYQQNFDASFGGFGTEISSPPQSSVSDAAIRKAREQPRLKHGGNNPAKDVCRRTV